MAEGKVTGSHETTNYQNLASEIAYEQMCSTGSSVSRPCGLPIYAYESSMLSIPRLDMNAPS